MSELMPFGKNPYGPVRRRMYGRRLARKTKRWLFGWTSRWGIDTWPKLFLAVFVAALFLFSFFMAAFSIGLPNPSRLVIYEATESTKVYDRNGVVLYDIFNEKRRTTVALEDIPDMVKQATIAIEDKDFYHHGGFDVTGFLRGILLQPLRGKGVQGGSTITQQFVKNALLTSDRTIARKAKELILAFEIEQIYSKDQILGLYLNEIPYGAGAYGVESAAETYFGKTVGELSLPEAAVLAALPQAPSRYSPYGQNPDLLMARKDLVLTQMHRQGYITKEEMDDAVAAEVEFQPRKESIRAPHFVMYVKELLADKYGEKLLEEGGLKITTTLDWEKQKAADDAISARAEANKSKYNAGNASLVSIDPNTGEILAMVGSKDYFDMEEDGQVNVAVRLNQPGSSFKPIVYATAFEKGYNPATMLVDVPTDFGQGYAPRNYDGAYRGPISIRDALQGSINIPAVKTLAFAGVQDTVNTAQDMGITTLTDPERYGLSLTLGGGDVTLLELTAAYGVFATGGMYTPTMAVLKVEDKNGRVLEENEPARSKRAIDAQAAYLINNVLSDDSARAKFFGAGTNLTLSGRTVAAKTGTTNDYQDGWTLGYTPDLVTGVWVGNNDNESMKNGAGFNVAAPIWNAYMRRALVNMPNKAFEVPNGIRQLEVDALTGLLPTDASPSTKTEVFASFNVPTASDNVHKKVRVVKTASDKLAPDSFPAELTEEKVFAEIHSERPSSPNWENPVLEWAKNNGYNNIPTQYYGGSADDVQIAVVMHQVSQTTFPVKLSANLTDYGKSLSGTKVQFYLDGAMVKEIADLNSLLEATVDEGVAGQHTAYVRLVTGSSSYNSSDVLFTTN
ncbi:MAG: transglycosylase domain-containing protein [Patescibacteria group bacterium]|nr:transglycosylase domain-containing protein [Patescibacteria group bacterium]